MTKALVTIEVDINTDHLYQSGLGESCNPQHPLQKRIAEAKRDWIWDSVAGLVMHNPEIKSVVKVSLTKEAS